MSFQLENKTEPSAPPSGIIEIWFDTTTQLIRGKDSSGNNYTLVENDLPINSLINGGMAIQQRIATASTAIAGISTTTRAGVVADRWAVTSSVASNLNWQQVDTQATGAETNLNSRFYGSIISATAGKKVMISQFIINREMAHLRGRKVRLSVKVKQTVGTAGQKYKLGLLQLTASGTVDVCPAFLTGAWSTTTGIDPSWGTNLSPIAPDSSPTGENGTINGNFLEILTTTGWVRSSCIFTVPTSSKNLVVVLFADATGGTTDNLSIAEFSLFEGNEKRDWIEPSFSDELSRCQAYYCKSFPYATVPAQNAGLNNSRRGSCGQTGAVSGEHGIFLNYPVTMWKVPTTVTLYNPSAANAFLRNVTGATDATATSSTSASDAGNCVTATGTAAWVKGDGVAIHFTADAEVVN